MLVENKAVIKRQDKLIVDLQQKNEVCQIAIAQTEEEVNKRFNERTALQIRLKELDDNRKQLNSNITTMNGKITEFVSYRNYQTQIEQERLKAQKAEDKRIAEEEKLMRGKRGLRKDNSGSPLKSAMAKQKSKSGSVRD